MATFSDKSRKDLADKGQAFQGGKYPVRNLSDLSNAIQAWGRSTPSERPALKSYLLRRAQAVGASQATINRIKTLKV